MAYHSSIEWTDATWNVVVGCSKVVDAMRALNQSRKRAGRRLDGVQHDGYPDGA